MGPVFLRSVPPGTYDFMFFVQKMVNSDADFSGMPVTMDSDKTGYFPRLCKMLIDIPFNFIESTNRHLL
jgi:hypothetical protein